MLNNVDWWRLILIDAYWCWLILRDASELHKTHVHFFHTSSLFRTGGGILRRQQERGTSLFRDSHQVGSKLICRREKREVWYFCLGKLEIGPQTLKITPLPPRLSSSAQLAVVFVGEVHSLQCDSAQFKGHGGEDLESPLQTLFTFWGFLCSSSPLLIIAVIIRLCVHHHVI